MKVLTPILVITSVVMIMGTRVVRADSDDDPVKKYGIMKIFESCYGAKLFKSLMKKKHDAEVKCQSLPVEGAEKSLGGASAPEPCLATIPEGTTTDFQYFTADRVRAVSNKIQANVSNKTCVYKTLGYMDSSNELLYDAMVQDIRTWGLEDQLEKDIVESVSTCQKMAACVPASSIQACVPLSSIQVPLTSALLRFKVFKKCQKQLKLNACIKTDLRARQAEFDLSGLSDAADDDEKLLAVIWSNSVVGDGGYLS